MKDTMKIKIRTFRGDNTYDQTKIIFELLKPRLNDTIRIWIYIKDIDNNYADVVRARNDIFDEVGLIPGKPFIASTGIGRPDDMFQDREWVHIDALIVPDLDQNDLSHMSNKDIMPDTSDYGVRFERGSIYKNLYMVSGTASIDKEGNVKFIDDLNNQVYQALDNIDALLKKYNQSILNTQKIIGYVRNKQDIPIVKELCNQHISSVDFEIIEGKVCRPEWLVEFETMFEI